MAALGRRTSRRHTLSRSTPNSPRAASRSYANTAPPATARTDAISAGEHVGKVEPIAKIRTDPCRLDNYTHALAAEQGNLYAAFPDERFSHFRKTDGYANMPLDGIWLRAPYLHNGSVPTVRDLLEPAEKRPKVFYRGYDVIDRDDSALSPTSPMRRAAQFFRYETQCVAERELRRRAEPREPPRRQCLRARQMGRQQQRRS